MYAQSTAHMLRMSGSLTATRLRFIVCILAIISLILDPKIHIYLDIPFKDPVIE